MSSDIKKMAYPKSVFFILSQEFCERFSYYGMRAVLSLYLLAYLNNDENLSTVIFHIFAFLCYFTPIFGSILADGFIGKFRTIFYLSIVYALGNAILSLAATEELIGLQKQHVIPISMIGLLFICIGTGGIKPCVAAFGGDQFVLPQQEKQLITFFSVFYFCINAGSLVSTVLTPYFRKEIHCFDNDTCYPLAFGVPAVLMLVSLIVFLIGKPFYKIHPPQGNVLVRVGKCMKHALSNKIHSREKREHWLDYADDKYDTSLIEDIKIVLRVLVLYIPLPVFWALYDQQGSTWTFQANRMDGYTFGWVILPDQFQVINALLILAFIPLFDIWIYPALAKVHVFEKPLQRMVTGGMLAGLAFVISGLVELKLQTTNPVIPKVDQSNLNFINTLPCSINISLNGLNSTIIEPNQNYIYELLEASGYKLNVQVINPKTEGKNQSMDEFYCNAFFDGMYLVDLSKQFQVQGNSKMANSILIVRSLNKTLEIIQPNVKDDLEKKEAKARLKVFQYGFDESWQNVSILLKPTVRIVEKKTSYEPLLDFNGTDRHTTEQQDLIPTEYNVWLKHSSQEEDGENLGKIELATGGSYILSIVKNYSHVEGSVMHNEPYAVGLQTVTKPNSMHILWLLPQYVVITLGEIMFSITGLSFSYAEAPESMKSVVQASWLLTVAVGNLIVVAIVKLQFFEKQSSTIFLFSGLMFLDMILFIIMAYFYKPRGASASAETNGNEIGQEPEQGGFPLTSTIDTDYKGGAVENHGFDGNDVRSGKDGHDERYD